MPLCWRVLFLNFVVLFVEVQVFRNGALAAPVVGLLRQGQCHRTGMPARLVNQQAVCLFVV